MYLHKIDPYYTKTYIPIKYFFMGRIEWSEQVIEKGMREMRKSRAKGRKDGGTQHSLQTK